MSGDVASTIEPKMVSVIIPTLNSATTLEVTLGSIQRQTYSTSEIVVVDGGSVDGTLEVAERFGVRIIERPVGRSSARRIGAEASQAEYVLFLDSDQEASPRVIEDCVQRCSNDEIVAVKIPEVDIGTGIWMRCRAIDRKILQGPDLAYPRFFNRLTYFRVGCHRLGLEDFMEDRDLYLRLVRSGAITAWSTEMIANHLGRLNPIEIGIKGMRTAYDSSEYYRRQADYSETPWSVIRPRVTAFLTRGHNIEPDFVALVLMPIYVLTVYGPRLVQSLMGYLESRTPIELPETPKS